MIGDQLKAVAGIVLAIFFVSVECRAEGGADPVSTAVAGPLASAPHVDFYRHDRLQWELENAAARLKSVENTIAESADRADQIASKTSRDAIIAVVVTAFLTCLGGLLAQYLLMRHQRSNSYNEWQLKQLSELYGPFRALLGQSNVLYRQMNHALIVADGTRFRLTDGSDFDGKEFQIQIDGCWMRFRTVKHLAEVYNRSYGVEPYFDDVVNVGARLAELIREKAGLARQEDSDLVYVMGEYLAHYLVLKRLHDSAKAGQSIHINAADDRAVFPVPIQEMVDNGFRAINEKILQWHGLS